MVASAQRFAGKVAVVTGGASGIGLAIARRLHAEGAKVVAGDVSADRLAEVAAELGEGFAWSRADVTREADGEALVALAAERFGGVDAAFNVAGGSKPGYIVDLAESDWDFTVDLCLKGVFLCMKHEARRMMERGPGGGAIVNVASLNAHVPAHGSAAYASAKAGVEMLTRNGALEWADAGIRVNAVLPGLVRTPLTRRYFDDPEVLAAFRARIPLGRPAEPGEIAGPALFLAGGDASYVSGASLLVDGAWAVGAYPDMRPFRGAPKWKPDQEPAAAGG